MVFVFFLNQYIYYKQVNHCNAYQVKKLCLNYQIKSEHLKSRKPPFLRLHVHGDFRFYLTTHFTGYALHIKHAWEWSTFLTKVVIVK